jgi:signal peptidase I
MDPTFATGQFLIVDRLTYRFENPSRGDVIVFKYPNNPSVYYIKRIVGLPGEIIDIQEGKISITKSVTSTTTNATTTFSSTLKVLLNEPYVENIHRSYDNFHTELSPNEYFVMGDNRAESSDSRVWGPLDKNLIVGRPIVRLLPITSVSILPGEYNQK